MTSKSLSYNRFWAKASEPEDLYHLLPYHNLDVAAVGVALLSNDLALCSRLRGLVSPQLAENLVPFITLLLAWHDVGKFSDSFQNLRPDLMNRLQGKESQERYILRHDSAGWLWFRHKSTQVRALILEGSRPLFRGCRTSDDTLDVLDPILRAVFGHHGRPPDQIKALSLGSSLFPQDADLAAMSFIEDTAKLLCGCPISITSDESFSEDCRGANTTAWLVAGLAVMCDWIGSNSEYFPFHPDPMSLKEYWHNYARPRAEKAVHELGILPCKARSFGGIPDVFGHIKLLTPLQEVCSTIQLSEGPQLFIIEDTTGAGKTEAAIALAHRLLADKYAQNVYFALPTMATANGVFGRIKPVFQELFDTDSRPSLVLSHSRRDLTPAFQELARISKQQTSRGKEEESGDIGCVAWFSDSRKKALLASFGVGTIDQALVGVLPIKHQSLRLFGASRSVLIIDEVHAFDPYMSKMICVLLEFQASFGAPVILLSATLPASLKEKFISAYCKGLGLAPVQQPKENPYPSLDVVSKKSLERITFPTRESVRRTLDISYYSEQEQVLDQIVVAVGGGKSVCWIRNTVRDATTAFSLIASRMERNGIQSRKGLRLFHSRFCFGHRQEIEESVLRVFGPHGGRSERFGQVLIATQVVEQSLDLDFDLMITDLAPIDLIIQRAGRLMRHTRDTRGDRIDRADERGTPRLCIFGPSLSGKPDTDWYVRFSKPASFVYPHHGQLYLTASTLSKATSIRVPEDFRFLVERVYGEDYLEDVPDSLKQSEIKARGADQGKTSLASINTLRVMDGYQSHLNEWSADVDTPTRLSNDQLLVTLVTVREGMIEPLVPGEKGWELSEVPLPAGYKGVDPTDEPSYVRQLIDRCLADPKHRWRKFVVVQESGNKYKGRIKRAKNGHIQCFTYDKRFGLELIEEHVI